MVKLALSDVFIAYNYKAVATETETQYDVKEVIQL